MANALGHVACRKARSVHFERSDRMLKRLKAARLDVSHEAEMRKLIRVDLLVLDDFCLHAMHESPWSPWSPWVKMTLPFL